MLSSITPLPPTPGGHLCSTCPIHSKIWNGIWNFKKWNLELLEANRRPFTKDRFRVLEKAKLCMAGTVPLALKYYLPPGAHLKWENRINLCQAAAVQFKHSQGLKAKRHSKGGLKHSSSPFLSCCSLIQSISKLLTSQLIPLNNYVHLNCKNNYLVLAHFCSRKESRFLRQVTSQFHCKVKLPAEPSGAK